MFELRYQYRDNRGGAYFFNDKEAAVRKAKEIIKEDRDNTLWDLAVYSGYFGADNMFQHSDTVFGYYNDFLSAPKTYEPER